MHYSPLFRYVSTSEAVANSVAGKLWLRPFAYFATIEDPNRSDDREGIASGKVSDGSSINWVIDKNMASPHFILSFTECDKSPKDWGCYRLELKDVEQFKQRIKQRMHGCIAFFDKVLYSDEVDYDTKPTGRELYDRAAITKPMRFSLEREWRLILILRGLSIINNPLKIDVDVLAGVLDYSPTNRA